MALQTIPIHLTGTVPILMHNGRLSNPLDPYAKAMKEISSKRTKTDADYERLADIEFEGSAYYNEEAGLHIPNHVMMGTIRTGAKRTRRGKDVACAVMIDDACLPLTHPREGDTIDELKDDLDYKFSCPVKVQQNRVIRTRCRIPLPWSIEFDLTYDDGTFSEEDLIGILIDAGTFGGIGDNRPANGRFTLNGA